MSAPPLPGATAPSRFGSYAPPSASPADADGTAPGMFAAVLEQVDAGVIACDATGRVTVFNATLRRYLGLDDDLSRAPGIALGLALDRLTTPVGSPVTARDFPLTRALAGERFERLEFLVTAPGVPPRVLLASGAPLREGDEIAGACATFRDVTQERRAERAKGELIATTGHELRTPLTAIRGALDLLFGKDGSGVAAEKRGLVEIVRRNVKGLMRLVEDLLDVERIESGASPMRLAVIDGAALIERALDSVAALADAAEVRIVADGAPVAVWADPDRVVQVLVNLLTNAIKFSAPGSVVTAASGADGDWVRFRVEDHGRGIPADKIGRVFERFEQVHATDARTRGAGLGLAISRAVVQQHGGRIWVESTVGVGSTFSFTVPMVEDGLVPID